MQFAYVQHQSFCRGQVPMHFVVRYWSSMLAQEFQQPGAEPRLHDYSIHPPSRLGLHNAMLVRNDRIEILESYGGDFRCEVYVVEGASAYVLTQEQAIKLFNALPSGAVKWLEIREFLLPPTSMPHSVDESQERHVSAHATLSHELQLHLFEYTHTLELEQKPHFDADA